MENSFWIPTLISVTSLIWNFVQSKKILKLETEAERKNLIHKFQFEKEFSVYTDLWAKLIDLRNVTASLRPMLDTRDSTKTEDEIKIERLTKQWEKLILVSDTFEKNRPFYSKDVYKEIDSLVKLSRFEAIDYEHGERHSREYWDEAQKNIKNIIDSMDKIATLIRKRIEVVEVTG
jgi:hypothetical protein